MSEIKVAAPRVAERVIDFAIQIHGGGGLSDDFPLAGAWTAARALRLADAPTRCTRAWWPVSSWASTSDGRSVGASRQRARGARRGRVRRRSRRPWLRDNASGNFEGVPEVRQFAGGASNLTYLLRYPDRDLVLRRPPAGAKPSSGHDMAREFRIQSLLAPVYPHVPAMVGLCTDPAVLGDDFYVMERVDGTILRSAPPQDLGLTPENTRELACEWSISSSSCTAWIRRRRDSTNSGAAQATSNDRLRDGPSATRLPAPTTSRTSRG